MYQRALDGGWRCRTRSICQWGTRFALTVLHLSQFVNAVRQLLNLTYHLLDHFTSVTSDVDVEIQRLRFYVVKCIDCHPCSHILDVRQVGEGVGNDDLMENYWLDIHVKQHQYFSRSTLQSGQPVLVLHVQKLFSRLSPYLLLPLIAEMTGLLCAYQSIRGASSSWRTSSGSNKSALSFYYIPPAQCIHRIVQRWIALHVAHAFALQTVVLSQG